MREKLQPENSGEIEALAAENNNGPKNNKESRSLTEAVKVLAALVFAFAIATVVLLILEPEIGLPITIVFIIVIPAMVMAICVLALIFLVIYLYEARLKVKYGEKLREINANLQQPSSPFRVVIVTGMNLIFLAMVNLFWTRIPMVTNITGDGPELVSLLSPEFAGVLPYLNLIIIATIIANILYLVIKIGWMPMAMETVLSTASAIFLYIVLTVFPFNLALNSRMLLAIRLGLIFIFVMTLIEIAKNLLKTITILLRR